VNSRIVETTEAEMAHKYLSCVLADYAPHRTPAPNLLALCVQIEDVLDARPKTRPPLRAGTQVRLVFAAASLALILTCCAETSDAPDASFGGRQIIGLGTLVVGTAGLSLSQPAAPPGYGDQQLAPDDQPQPIGCEMARTARIGGRPAPVHGVAGLNPNGPWLRVQ
jgi:hypothetical protein